MPCVDIRQCAFIAVGQPVPHVGKFNLPFPGAPCFSDIASGFSHSMYHAKQTAFIVADNGCIFRTHPRISCKYGVGLDALCQCLPFRLVHIGTQQTRRNTQRSGKRAFTGKPLRVQSFRGNKCRAHGRKRIIYILPKNRIILNHGFHIYFQSFFTHRPSTRISFFRYSLR